MALIFDRNNKVSLVCILIDLEMASSENPTINLDPIHSKGGSLGGKPSIRGRRDVVTATNRPARSKWKFVAVLFFCYYNGIFCHSGCAAKWKIPFGLLW